jgi:drug/metabolite transporter (DMT)-like permease
MYKPRLKSTPLNMVGLTALSSLFGVIQMVLKYYGFRDLGVIETTMVLLLGPFMVYAFSYFYFHERSMYKKDLTCAVVVIACIIYSTLVG